MCAIRLMTAVTIFLTKKQRSLCLKRLLRSCINWKILEKNNFKILLKKECGKDQYRYQIRSAKISFSCLRQFCSAWRKDEQLNIAKYNVLLFSKLFRACQTREGDLENFFAHENQPNPPSLSDRGELRPAKSKSGTVDYLLPNEDSMPCESLPVDCKVFDVSALAHILSPESNCKSFIQYAKEVFVPYLKFHTKSVHRLDLVFDRYLEDNLKTGTRSKLELEKEFVEKLLKMKYYQETGNIPSL